MKTFFSFDRLRRWLSPEPPESPELARLRQENENLKTDLKNYSTIINMAPYPMWQRDSSLALRYYNLSYSEAVEDIADLSDGSETPELDKKTRIMAAQAFESGKPINDRRHIVIGGERRLYDIMELPVPEEKISVGFAIDVSEL